MSELTCQSCPHFRDGTSSHCRLNPPVPMPVMEQGLGGPQLVVHGAFPPVGADTAACGQHPTAQFRHIVRHDA